MKFLPEICFILYYNTKNRTINNSLTRHFDYYSEICHFKFGPNWYHCQAGRFTDGFLYTLAEGILILVRSLQRSEGEVSDLIRNIFS